MITLKKQLISYLSKRKFKSQSAFTLVELIVVVVIIGILSSIAVPSFQSAAEKAKQKEASTAVGSYLKAAQAFYTEYGTLAYRAVDIGEYVKVTACRYNSAQNCKTRPNALVDYSRSTTTNWYSQSGNYRIILSRTGNTRLNVLANPNTPSGLGVAGCFNVSTGATKLEDKSTTGTVRAIQC